MSRNHRPRHYHDPYLADRCDGCARLRESLELTTRDPSGQTCGALTGMFVLTGISSAVTAGIAVWAILRARRR